jgi:TolA-binding protein
MKKEVSNGANTTQGQIKKKCKAANDLLMLESRLPLVRSLNVKVQKNMDDTFQNNLLAKFDDVDEEVNSAIKKVRKEIEELNDSIKHFRIEIARMQEEERREAERTRNRRR